MKVLIKTSDAIEHFKNASHLADEIGITPQAVNQWGNMFRILPLEKSWLLFQPFLTKLFVVRKSPRHF
ncbi:Cro/CI family transcriptional regulator (plasmid) [Acinetobacter thermotolerans]|uniref:Cro/CI family transcriptional regulator n=1 Tax=Acinetobacter thermotolerans TaxID=3151487 RepID=UPI00325A68CB